MANRFGQRVANAGVRVDASLDEGLRSYMLSVYNYMGLALALTGLTAFVTFQLAISSPAVAQALYGSPLQWVIMLAPLGFVFFLSARLPKMSASTAQLTFWTFAVLMGLSLSSIFLVYTGTSIARVFFITAATFGAMSLYGYTTKNDLSKYRSFLMMGLIGIIIAMVVNIFLASSALMFAISVIGVLVFIGLTAYDTQAIKEEYVGGLQYAEGDTQTKGAISGALRLYLDFINLFIMLLHLFGNRE